MKIPSYRECKSAWFYRVEPWCDFWELSCTKIVYHIPCNCTAFFYERCVYDSTRIALKYTAFYTHDTEKISACCFRRFVPCMRSSDGNWDLCLKRILCRNLNIVFCTSSNALLLYGSSERFFCQIVWCNIHTGVLSLHGLIFYVPTSILYVWILCHIGYKEIFAPKLLFLQSLTLLWLQVPWLALLLTQHWIFLAFFEAQKTFPNGLLPAH